MSQEANSAFAVENDDFEDMFGSALQSSEENPNEEGFAALTGQGPKEKEKHVEEEKAFEEVEDILDDVSFETEPEPEPTPEPEPVKLIRVKPSAPQRIDEENAIVIPDVTGVEYVIGDEVFDGEIEFDEDGLVITAYPEEGYDFSNRVKTEWSFDYIEEPEPEPVIEPEPEPTPEPEPEPEPVYEPEPEPVVQEVPETTPEADLDLIEQGDFDPGASQPKSIKSGVDYNVSLETLSETIKVLDAYRSLEDDEAEFASKFIGLGSDAVEAEIVSAVLNADALLFDVFESIKEANTYDATEIAFYIVSLKRSVMKGISFVAAQYLGTEPADGHLERVPYARAIVTQLKQLDGTALRLVDAAHNLIKGEMRDEDSEFSK